jgi:hypothetical protein
MESRGLLAGLKTSATGRCVCQMNPVQILIHTHTLTHCIFKFHSYLISLITFGDEYASAASR